MTENERFGLVFVKTGSINSGTDESKMKLRKLVNLTEICKQILGVTVSVKIVILFHQNTIFSVTKLNSTTTSRQGHFCLLIGNR
jgi:hypothetical protein